MITMLLTLLALLLGLAFIAAVIVGFPSFLYMLYLWFRLERELIVPKPFGFLGANLIWNPIPDKYSLQGQELIPAFLKWLRIGFVCLLTAAITGPGAMWVTKIAA